MCGGILLISQQWSNYGLRDNHAISIYIFAYQYKYESYGFTYKHVNINKDIINLNENSQRFHYSQLAAFMEPGNISHLNCNLGL